MPALHTYDVDLVWLGARDVGTVSYTSYGRDHELRATDRPPLPGTSDPAFRGDPTRWSPEDLLVGALAQCHMLWLLHLAAEAGVVVVDYTDRASGTMRIEAAGHGQFRDVVLRPQVTLASATTTAGGPITDELLAGLHERAHEHCFIARSVNFPVDVRPTPVVVR
ncbi:MAG: OsmC family protein [Actinobacteria bacterium]|nr:OsmC family protein [Actinomycetota bacterium]MCG2801084.1 OsmC family protein [Cellulomonas sp.]